MELDWYKKVRYEDKKELAKESLTKMVSSFVAAGYWIRSIWEDKECESEGYGSIWEMAEKEFGLKKSEASRAISMNKKYSVDGNSPVILERYVMYNKSQLQEMLTMTEEQLEQVTVDMKVQELRQLKRAGATPEQLRMLKELLADWVKSAYVEIYRSVQQGKEIMESIGEILNDDVPVKKGDKVFFTGEDVDELVERTTGEVLAKYSKGMAVSIILEEYCKLQELRKIKKKPEIRGLMDDPYCRECGTPLDSPEHGKNPSVICSWCGQAVDWSDYSVEESVATSQEPVITGTEAILEAETIEKDLEVFQEPAEDVTEVLIEAEIVEEIEADEEECAEVFAFEVLDSDEEAESIIDGEFREISMEVIGEEEVSVYGLPKTVYPEGSSISTVGCGHKYNCFSCAQECDMRQEKRYCREATLGSPFSCTTMNVLELLKEEFAEVCQFVNYERAEYTAGSKEPVPCCKKCQVSDCGYRCGRSVYVKTDTKEVTEPEETTMAAVEESELMQIKKVLEKENELLAEYLKIDDLPVFTVKRQKIIVGALANMVCELEEMEQKTEPVEQPELPILKNNDQRQEFIADYENWPVWMEQPLTGEKYYRYEFENGAAFVVKAYFHKCFDINIRGKWEDRYKDGWGAEEYYIMTEGKHFKDCLTNKSCMIEFLKNLQKEKK